MSDIDLHNALFAAKEDYKRQLDINVRELNEDMGKIIVSKLKNPDNLETFLVLTNRSIHRKQTADRDAYEAVEAKCTKCYSQREWRISVKDILGVQ